MTDQVRREWGSIGISDPFQSTDQFPLKDFVCQGQLKARCADFVVQEFDAEGSRLAKILFPHNGDIPCVSNREIISVARTALAEASNLQKSKEVEKQLQQSKESNENAAQQRTPEVVPDSAAALTWDRIAAAVDNAQAVEALLAEFFVDQAQQGAQEMVTVPLQTAEAVPEVSLRWQRDPDNRRKLTALIAIGPFFRWRPFQIKDTQPPRYVLRPCENIAAAFKAITVPDELGALAAYIWRSQPGVPLELALTDKQVCEGVLVARDVEDREMRTAVHHMIRKQYSSLDTRAIRTEDGKSAIRITRRGTAGSSRGKKKRGRNSGAHADGPVQSKRQRKDEEPKAFVGFTVCKRGLEHFAASRILASVFGLKAKDLTFAGIKDKRAVTAQFCVVNARTLIDGLDRRRRRGDKGEDADEDVNHRICLQVHPKDCREEEEKEGNALYVHTFVPAPNGPLYPGAAAGNAFQIVLREMMIAEQGNRTNLEGYIQRRLAKHGEKKIFPFINFYGWQRFGKQTPETDRCSAVEAGLAALRGDFQQCLEIQLSPANASPTDPKLQKALCTLRDSHNPKLAAKQCPPSAKREHSLLCALNRLHGPLNNGGQMRMDNDLACQVLKEGMDYHMRTLMLHSASGYLWNRASSERMKGPTDSTMDGDAKSGTDPWLLRGDADDHKGQKLVLRQGTVSSMPLLQVTMPMIGHSVILPDHSSANFMTYASVLQNEGLQWPLPEARSRPLEVNLPGAHRQLVALATGMDITVVATNQIRLSFCLPSGCYATMVLRELFGPWFEGASMLGDD
eukprot:Clim_evm1s45 gene=Clim_evmTU1s45